LTSNTSSSSHDTSILCHSEWQRHSLWLLR
jgi:hypothetical protein